MESDDEGKIAPDMQKAKDIAFERNDSGDFILPPMYNCKTTRQKQRVIRGYIGTVYRKPIKSRLNP
jgi:hypothetical protein